MEARDFRSIGRAAQEELRRRALLLIEQQGLSQGQAAQMVGVHRQTVNIWLKCYREHGEDGLLDGRRVSPRRGQTPVRCCAPTARASASLTFIFSGMLVPRSSLNSYLPATLSRQMQAPIVQCATRKRRRLFSGSGVLGGRNAGQAGNVLAW